jgi:hypothetical protein
MDYIFKIQYFTDYLRIDFFKFFFIQMLRILYNHDQKIVISIF